MIARIDLAYEASYLLVAEKISHQWVLEDCACMFDCPMFQKRDPVIDRNRVGSYVVFEMTDKWRIELPKDLVSEHGIGARHSGPVVVSTQITYTQHGLQIVARI